MAPRENLKQTLAAYHGTWVKDNAASDSLEPAIRLIHLNRVMRQAVRLIRGVQLGIEQEQLRFSVFSAIPWFKISEYYPWSGAERENRRRDMRRGRSKGSVGVTPKGTIQLQYNWGAPHGGTGVDEFSIDPKGRLQLCTLATVADESVEYCQVYNKRN